MKDVKTMIKETTLEETKGLSPNHRALFEQRLNSAMAPKKLQYLGRPLLWLFFFLALVL